MNSVVAAQSLVQPVDWLAIAPPLVVAVTAVGVLIVDAFSKERRIAGLPLPGIVSIVGLAVALALLMPLRGAPRGTFCVLGTETTGACSYVVDTTTLVFSLVILGGTLLVVLVPLGSADPPPGEFHFLLLCSATGAVALAGARDLITLVVALELLSLPGFALVGLRRRAERASAEAALKFFLVSVVSVAVMLFGISLVYGATGTVHYGPLAARLAEGDYAPVAAAGTVLTLVGLAFKVAAVPFHFWVPDTYVGAPIPVAAYLAVVSKAAGFVGFVALLGHAFGPYAHVWGPAIAVMAALTMTVGNLAALRQRHAVRLLAWSSVAQAGYMLVPVGAAAGAPDRAEVVLAATVAYVVIYAAMNLGAFAVVAGYGRVALDDYRGLARRQPATALPLAFFLLCLAGLPPGVIGLFAKLVILRAAVDAGVGWLAVVAAVNVAIGLAYYLYWAALLFRPAETAEPQAPAPEAEPAEAGELAGAGTAGAVATTARPAVATSVRAGLVVGVTLGLTVVLSVVPGVVLDVLARLP